MSVKTIQLTFMFLVLIIYNWDLLQIAFYPAQIENKLWLCSQLSLKTLMILLKTSPFLTIKSEKTQLKRVLGLGRINKWEFIDFIVKNTWLYIDMLYYKNFPNINSLCSWTSQDNLSIQLNMLQTKTQYYNNFMSNERNVQEIQ